MTVHHSEDYKISAVKYHLDNKTTYTNVCKIWLLKEIPNEIQEKGFRVLIIIIIIIIVIIIIIITSI